MSKKDPYHSKIYLAFHKPYGVLSQFSKETPEDITLKDFLEMLPQDVYPVGRLDKDSEGLLLLTNDNYFKTSLLNPKSKQEKTYLVQVDGEISTEAILKLQKGVTIRINKKDYKTLPARAVIIPNPQIPERIPPIRYRKNIPTSWIEITIVEGKNRQIRRMGASIGFPVLRLIRKKIGTFSLGNLKSGEYTYLTKEDIVT